MSFYEYLIETFGYNEPIFPGEIAFGSYSKPWINKELAKLCEERKLIRFEKGVYYVPKNTPLGPSSLNPMKIIDKRYILDGGERSGYYSGPSFLNWIGLSDQVPGTVEIYTNNESSKVREILVGPVKVLLRRARVKIDNGNVAVQSFLELMNSVNPSFFDDERKRITESFIRDNGITRGDITKYASYFPDKSMRNLIESEMIYCVA